jgi:MoaA/NifB/PqqE/SkfB family radical SAM enzyme
LSIATITAAWVMGTRKNDYTMNLLYRIAQFAYYSRLKLLNIVPYSRKIAIAINNYCNLECSHCSLWRASERCEILYEDIDSILNALPKGPIDFQITGGEPFLHKHLLDICALLKSRSSSRKIVITTNGTLTKEINKVLNKLPENKSFHICVSLNGLEKDLFQKKRLSHQQKSVLDTLEMLKQDFPGLSRSIKYLITDYESLYLKEVYKICVEYGCRLQCKFMEYATEYTQCYDSQLNQKQFLNPPFMKKLAKEEKTRVLTAIKLFLEGNLSHAIYPIKERLYLYQMYKFLKSGSLPTGPCPAPKNYREIRFDGRFYPCRYLDLEIGHIKQAKELFCQSAVRSFREDDRCPNPKHRCLGFWNYYI